MFWRWTKCSRGSSDIGPLSISPTYPRLLCLERWRKKFLEISQYRETHLASSLSPNAQILYEIKNFKGYLQAAIQRCSLEMFSRMKIEEYIDSVLSNNFSTKTCGWKCKISCIQALIFFYFGLVSHFTIIFKREIEGPSYIG